MDQLGSGDVAPRGHYERPYRRIAADLRGKILAGRWQHGDRLPTVAELQEEYGHSKNTIAGAVRQLRAEGLVVTRGKSHYVQKPPPKDAGETND